MIEPPIAVHTITYKNRYVIKTDNTTMIVVTDASGAVRELIEHSKDYKTINIKLSKRLVFKLAEQEYLLTGLIFLEIAALEKKLVFYHQGTTNYI